MHRPLPFLPLSLLLLHRRRKLLLSLLRVIRTGRGAGAASRKLQAGTAPSNKKTRTFISLSLLPTPFPNNSLFCCCISCSSLLLPLLYACVAFSSYHPLFFKSVLYDIRVDTSSPYIFFFSFRYVFCISVTITKIYNTLLSRAIGLMRTFPFTTDTFSLSLSVYCTHIALHGYLSSPHT